MDIKAVVDGTVRYMDKDRVRPAQAQSYLALLSKDGVAERLDTLRAKDAHGWRGGVDASTGKALRQEMEGAGLPTSHIWVKGLVATYLSVRDLALA